MILIHTNFDTAAKKKKKSISSTMDIFVALWNVNEKYRKMSAM